MFSKINMTMADGNQQEFEFVSNGLTQYRYRQIFGGDLVRDISKLTGSNKTDVGNDADFTTIDKLAYIMNMSATKADMNKLNMDAFYEWIEQFDSSNSLQVMSNIIDAYFGTKKSTSEPKKEDGE